MAAVLRSGYTNYLRMAETNRDKLRHMIYRSLASMVPVVITTDRDDVLGSNFGLAVTFGVPGEDKPFDRFGTTMQVVKDMPGDLIYPLPHLQESIVLEKQCDIDGIVAGFQAKQDALAEDAVLLSVAALFGFTQPVNIDGEQGILAVTHAPTGDNSVLLINHMGEIMKAQRLLPDRLFNISGNSYDLQGDLAVMYDVLTSQDDELLTLG